MRQDDLVDVESVSDELYGLALDDFTSARNRREKQAKAAGEEDLAAQVHQLTKPNLVAWLANQVERERADEIRPLLELGAALREATATLSGQQLLELSRQQTPGRPRSGAASPEASQRRRAQSWRGPHAVWKTPCAQRWSIRMRLRH